MNILECGSGPFTGRPDKERNSVRASKNLFMPGGFLGPGWPSASVPRTETVWPKRSGDSTSGMGRFADAMHRTQWKARLIVNAMKTLKASEVYLRNVDVLWTVNGTI